MQFDPEIYLKELRRNVRSGVVRSNGSVTKDLAARFAATASLVHKPLAGEARDVLAQARRTRPSAREVEWFSQAFDGQLLRLSLLSERWAAREKDRHVPGTDWQA